MSDNDGQGAETNVQPLAEVKRIGIIRISVSDLDRSVRWYREMLGFAEGEQMLTPGVMLAAGEATIYLTGGATPRVRDEESAEISLCLIVPSVGAAYEKLREAGVTITGDYQAPSEHFATLQIADPDGNSVELWGAA